ncbi:MAG: hypothetical protein LBJ25_00855 [Candidatus Margulisbacteria bacterium]|nr:hypothetical protein [Candidatus Margulisiibacteriota bacterium]
MTIAKGQPMVADDLLHLLFFPKGTILMFSGSEYTELTNAAATAYKDVWKLCDGQNGTPDLIDKFIRAGASSGGVGGSDSVTLTAVNIPAHNHGLSNVTVGAGDHVHAISGTAASEGGHMHTVSGNVDSGGVHRHAINMLNSNGKHSGSNNNPSWDYTASTYYTETGGEHGHTFSNGVASGGGHTHPLSGTATGGSHSHTLTGSTDSSSGTASPVGIVPSYYTLVYIMKVK